MHYNDGCSKACRLSPCYLDRIEGRRADGLRAVELKRDGLHKTKVLSLCGQYKRMSLKR